MVGAGATGGYFGGRLQEAGRDVTFLVRPRRAEVLRDRGLRITGLGRETVLTPRLLTAPELDGDYDLVLVSVKATALPAAIEDVSRAVGARTCVVPFLNGMAHMDALNKAFGSQAVLGGVVRLIATLADDGDIVQLAPPADMVIGEQGGGVSERLRLMESVLSGAGFAFEVSPDIRSAMWHKWVFISTLGALNVLARGSVGEVVAAEGGGAVAAEGGGAVAAEGGGAVAAEGGGAAAESGQVAAAEGGGGVAAAEGGGAAAESGQVVTAEGGERLGPAVAAEAAAISAAAGHPVPAQTMANIVAFMTRSGSTDTASIYRDLAAGRPTEAEQILGDLTARARALDGPKPLLDLATLSLRVHENRLKR